MIALSAIVSGFETALFTLRDHHTKGLAEGNRRLGAILRLQLRRSDETQIVVLILSAVFNLSVLVLGLYLIERLYESPAAMVGLVFGVILLGDLVPKLLALTYPGATFRFYARPFLALSLILRPISHRVLAASHWFEQHALPKSIQRRERYTEDEYGALVAIHQEEGAISIDEGELIVDIVKLGNKTAKDCMVSRVDAFCLPAGMKKEEIFTELQDTDWHKVPVYRGSPDMIVAILDVRKALQHEEEELTEAFSTPQFVPETMMALTAFRDYLQEPHSMVIVLDEFGGTEGVLTHEDILREFIDLDATPDQVEESELEKLDEEHYSAPGTARLDEVSEVLGIDLEAEGLDTIGGLVFNRLGYMPLPGESVDLGPVRVVVRRVGKKRIEELLIERSPQV